MAEARPDIPDSEKSDRSFSEMFSTPCLRAIRARNCKLFGGTKLPPPYMSDNIRTVAERRDDYGSVPDDVRRELRTVRQDTYLGVDNIVGLNQTTFPEFVTNYDMAMVFFYDPTNPASEEAKAEYIKATKTTFRKNHAFAAVNCIQESQLCSKENISKVPAYKLYSKGITVSTVESTKGFGAQEIKKLMQDAPLGGVGTYRDPKTYRPVSQSTD